jgi:hypothetical protein
VFTGDPGRAGPLLDEAHEAALSAHDPWAVVHSLLGMGQLALLTEDLGLADERLRTAEEAARDLGNAFSLASVLNRRATVTGLQGDERTTAALLAESAELSVHGRIGWTLGYALPALAGVAVSLGEDDTAARLFGASASLTAAQGVDPRFPVSSAMSSRALVQVRERLGQGAFSRSWDAGRLATLDEVARLAGVLRDLAHA